MDVNPGNKISNYKVRLAKPIRFAQGTEWEVGLKDISFTRSWYTLNFEQKIKYFNIGQSEHGVISKTVSEAYATLQPGYFTSPQSVINELAVTLRDNNWGGIIELNPLTKTVIVKPKVVTNITKTKEKKKYISHLSYPLFSEELLEFLGLYSAYDHFFTEKLKSSRPKRHKIDPILAEFGTILQKSSYGVNHNKRKDNVSQTSERYHQIDQYGFNPIPFEQAAYNMPAMPEHPELNIVGTVPINLLAECHSLFVYTDIVESSRVGDSFTQLLNVIAVPTKTEFGEQVFVRYERPYYHRVSKSDFEEIEIDIKDDTGASVPFRFGRTIVTLEFRRVQ